MGLGGSRRGGITNCSAEAAPNGSFEDKEEDDRVFSRIGRVAECEGPMN